MKRTSVLLAVCVALCTTTLMAEDLAPADVSIKEFKIAESLTGKPGDPKAGRETFANRKLGNCLACHANADLSEQLFHGGVGPTLNGSGSRWSSEQLRAILVNAKAVFTEHTVMPAFYSLDVGQNVRKDLVGKTILTAQQVEDVVAYLTTLK